MVDTGLGLTRRCLSSFFGFFGSRLGSLGHLGSFVVDDLGALVGQRDGQALVEEGHFLQTTRNGLEVVAGGLEDLGIRPETDGGAGLLRRVALYELSRLGIGVRLLPPVAVDLDVDVEPGGKSVDHRDTDAVQTTGDGVRVGVELAAGVQLGQHDLDGGGDSGGVHADRDATAVVDDADSAVFEEGDLDLGGVSGHRLVDRVVDDLPNEVVQAAFTGGTDVHAWTLTYRLESFEDGDGRRVVVLAGSACI